MQLTEFTKYTGMCFNGEPASCSCACPFGLDVRGFAEKCEKGRWNAAWKAYKTAVVFPALVAALCPAPCQSRCQRTGLGGPIDLPGLEKAVIQYASGKKAEGYNIPPKTQTVAVVGAGAAGLSAALNLALKKYIVTVFDKQPGWGGSLRSHPAFDSFDAEFRFQFSAVKEGFVSFVFDKEADAAALTDYDAVCFATGQGGFSLEGEKYFAVGSLAGRDLMEGIAMGPEASKVIETYLMTGRSGEIQPPPHAAKCDRYVTHQGVQPADPADTTTEEGAKAEAARCMKCDCTDCIDGCEMLRQYRKMPHALAREAYADSSAAPPIATQSLVRQTYSCTNCGNCQAVCPEHANLGAMFMLSRADRFRRGTGPRAFHDFWLREMDFATGEAAAFLPPKGKETCTYAFFPGCRLGMSSPSQVTRAYRFLQESTGGDTGLMLGCCGVPALWAGDLDRVQANRDKLRGEWEKLGKPTLVFACATCERTFAEYLPEIPMVSLYRMLADAGFKPEGETYSSAAVFDPCAASHNSDMRAAVRSLAASAGTQLEDMAKGPRCCGFGGHIQIPNPSLFETLGQQAAQASDAPYLVYCANCREVFQAQGKACRHILDVYFGETDRKDPSLLEKRQNALTLKQTLLKEEWDMDFTPARSPWDDLMLTLAEELPEKLEKCFISQADLKEAIWSAETGGDKLTGEDGWCLASLVKDYVTYWVQYRPLPDSENAFQVAAAYSHRMKWRAANI